MLDAHFQLKYRNQPQGFVWEWTVYIYILCVYLKVICQYWCKYMPPLRNCSLKKYEKINFKSVQYFKNNGASGLLLIFFKKSTEFTVWGMYRHYVSVCLLVVYQCCSRHIKAFHITHVTGSFIMTPTLAMCLILIGTDSNYTSRDSFKSCPGGGEGAQCGIQVHPFWRHPPEMLHIGPKY